MVRDDRALHEAAPQQFAGTRQRKRASEIIDATARVFAERGYHGTSTQDIAEALGLRQGSIYYYFPSKEAALERVCEHGVDGFVEAAEAIVRTAGTPREGIERLIASHLAPLETRRDYVRVFVNERRYLPTASRRRIGRASRRLEQLFQEVIESGVRDGSFHSDVDARLAALAILGMCNAVINWRPDEPNTAAAPLAAEFARLVLCGLQTKATRAAAGRVAGRAQLRDKASPGTPRRPRRG